MNHEADSRPSTSAPGLEQLRAVISDLENALQRLDALGLSVAANHVSQGLELAREQASSFENGDNLWPGSGPAPNSIC